MRSVKHKKNIFAKILLVLLNIMMGINIYLLVKIAILPVKYFTLVIGGFILIDILFSFLLLRNKKKGRKILSPIFAIIGIILLGVLAYYLFTTVKFFHKIDSKKEVSEANYLVIVLNDSEYKSLKDLSGKLIGYSKSALTGQDKALKSLEEYSLVNKMYDDNSLLTDALINKDVDSILMEEAIYELFKEEKDNFESLTRVLHENEVVVEIEEDNDEKPKENTFDEALAGKYGAFNLYISGIDVAGSVNKISRSDVNIIVSVNPTTHKILITHIPRDYFIPLRGVTGKKDKLTNAAYYGINMSIGTIEDLLDIRIKYYVKVNFTSVTNIIDMLGGVDVYSDYDFPSGGYTFTTGWNHLDGAKALVYSRERKWFKGGDRVRGQHQQQVLEALINKCLSPSILSNYGELLSQVSEYVATNVSTSEITNMVNKQLSSGASWSILKYNLNGSDSMGYTYSNPSLYNYVMIPNESTISTGSTKIKNICYGK